MIAREPARESIGVVLPARETFLARKSGALALCARDFARFSRFRGSIVIAGASPCEYDDVNYLRLENWRRWWRRGRTAYAEAVARAGRERGWRLIEIYNRPPAVAILRARLPGVRLALHLGNDAQTMDGAKTPAERTRLLGQLDAVICCSNFVREKFLESVRDEAGKVLVVHNGVDTEVAAAPKERIVAFVGRIIPAKGAVELVHAFALAAPHLPGWRLVLAGEDRDGLLARPVEALADKVTLMGQVSHADAMAIYARAEIAATPSLWDEPFGRSAIEAMTHGCALLSTARGGLKEVVGDAGEIVTPEDAVSFAAALRRVAEDQPLRRRLQQAGQARARALFDIRAVTRTLDDARARLLASP